MAYFASRSLKMLSECHWDLQRVAQEAIKEIDFTVICGFRDKKPQIMARYSGASKLEWPDSKHNKFLSEAFDFIPCPFTNWEDIERFETVARVIKASAVRLGIEIELGAEWKMKDVGHIQLEKDNK